METKLRVAFASDDVNEAVECAKDYLQKNYDFCIGSESDCWPIMASDVSKMVVEGKADFGVLMCWSGTGTAIAANKIKGIRAATVLDAWTAKGARLWNDANVIALSLKRLAPDVIIECLEAFLTTEAPEEAEVETIALLEELP